MQHRRGRSGVDRRVIALAVAIPVVIVLIGAALGVTGDGTGPGTGTTADDETPTTDPVTTSTGDVAVDQDWNDALATALRPLTEVLPRYARTVDDWSTGAATAEDLTATLDDLEPALRQVRDRAAGLAVHPEDRLARPLVVHSVDLYVSAFGAHRLALATTGAVSEQYDRLGRRLRLLGDRVFDRARERTARALGPPDGVTLALPAEVPDWTRLGMAVGPPLEEQDTNVTDGVPRQRADDRASQPEQAWVEAVGALDAPGIGDVEAAFGDADTLAGHAQALVAAADALRDVPVPDGDRGRADRLALGWLVLADAARAAQLQALSGAGDDLVAALVDLASAPELQLG